MLPAFGSTPFLTDPVAIVACLRGRSGDGASSWKFCGAVKRADRPYVTTFLRRSGIVNIDDTGDAMAGGCAVAKAGFRRESWRAGWFVDVGMKDNVQKSLAD